MEKHNRALRLQAILHDEDFNDMMDSIKIGFLTQMTVVQDEALVLDIHKKMLAVDYVMSAFETKVNNLLEGDE